MITEFSIILILTIFLWFVYCNIKTYKQREKIMRFVFSNVYLYKGRLKLFEDVSYDKHLWNLIMFKDSLKLYDSRITDNVN